MMTLQTRVFVVHMSYTLGARLFLKAKEIGMMDKGYAWIITSGLTDSVYLMDSDVAEAMQGVLGVKPLIPKSKQLNSLRQ
uniref:Putative ovule protein n=1 Tax=Solanum chacoense TaxID=4108 RepID=A0A0V0GUQ1_SOLCH